MNEALELTIDEANALVPTLHRIVSRQLRLQAEAEQLARALHGLLGHLPREIVPMFDDAPEVHDVKEKLLVLLRDINDGWARVHDMGGVVKDPTIGLVDFYGRVAGESVFLCWRFGEEAISHYHRLDEGFAGRKPLPGATRRHPLFD